jgi:prepilin-type N-terminal cleavage/methylation domain-containing protein
MKNQKAFTLIELLVVISIIAILAAVGLVVYGGVQRNGRISKRVQDLKAIRTAVEAYKVDNGSYPDSAGKIRSECVVTGGVQTTGDSVVPGLTPKYMASFPADPSMDKANGKSCYLYYSDTVNFKVFDYNVAEFFDSDYLKQPGMIDPVRDGGVNNTFPGCTIDYPASSNGTTHNITAWAIASDPTTCW